MADTNNNNNFADLISLYTSMPTVSFRKTDGGERLGRTYVKVLVNGDQKLPPDVRVAFGDNIASADPNSVCILHQHGDDFDTSKLICSIEGQISGNPFGDFNRGADESWAPKIFVRADMYRALNGTTKGIGVEHANVRPIFPEMNTDVNAATPGAVGYDFNGTRIEEKYLPIGQRYNRFSHDVKVQLDEAKKLILGDEEKWQHVDSFVGKRATRSVVSAEARRQGIETSQDWGLIRTAEWLSLIQPSERWGRINEIRSAVKEVENYLRLSAIIKDEIITVGDFTKPTAKGTSMRIRRDNGSYRDLVPWIYGDRKEPTLDNLMALYNSGIGNARFQQRESMAAGNQNVTNVKSVLRMWNREERANVLYECMEKSQVLLDKITGSEGLIAKYEKMMADMERAIEDRTADPRTIATWRLPQFSRRREEYNDLLQNIRSRADTAVALFNDSLSAVTELDRRYKVVYLKGPENYAMRVKFTAKKVVLNEKNKLNFWGPLMDELEKLDDERRMLVAQMIMENRADEKVYGNPIVASEDGIDMREFPDYFAEILPWRTNRKPKAQNPLGIPRLADVVEFRITGQTEGSKGAVGLNAEQLKKIIDIENRMRETVIKHYYEATGKINPALIMTPLITRSRNGGPVTEIKFYTNPMTSDPRNNLSTERLSLGYLQQFFKQDHPKSTNTIRFEISRTEKKNVELRNAIDKQKDVVLQVMKDQKLLTPEQIMTLKRVGFYSKADIGTPARLYGDKAEKMKHISSANIKSLFSSASDKSLEKLSIELNELEKKEAELSKNITRINRHLPAELEKAESMETMLSAFSERIGQLKLDENMNARSELEAEREARRNQIENEIGNPSARRREAKKEKEQIARAFGHQSLLLQREVAQQMQKLYNRDMDGKPIDLTTINQPNILKKLENLNGIAAVKEGRVHPGDEMYIHTGNGQVKECIVTNVKDNGVEYVPKANFTTLEEAQDADRTFLPLTSTYWKEGKILLPSLQTMDVSDIELMEIEVQESKKEEEKHRGPNPNIPEYLRDAPWKSEPYGMPGEWVTYQGRAGTISFNDNGIVTINLGGEIIETSIKNKNLVKMKNEQVPWPDENKNSPGSGATSRSR